MLNFVPWSYRHIERFRRSGYKAVCETNFVLGNVCRKGVIGYDQCEEDLHFNHGILLTCLPFF